MSGSSAFKTARPVRHFADSAIICNILHRAAHKGYFRTPYPFYVRLIGFPIFNLRQVRELQASELCSLVRSESRQHALASASTSPLRCIPTPRSGPSPRYTQWSPRNVADSLSAFFWRHKAINFINATSYLPMRCATVSHPPCVGRVLKVASAVSAP